MVPTEKRPATLAGLIVVAFLVPCLAQADDHGRGEELFALCTQCHGPNGGGMEMALAPAIAGLDQWYVESQLTLFRSGARGLHPEDIGGMRMHPMARWLRSDDDLQSVAAYVAGLPPTNPQPVLEGGDAEKGKQLYAACQACHGTNGEGDQSKNSPKLAGSSDWYILSTLQKYKAGIRGGNPANANAVLMRGMSNILIDDQAMRDVVAHISTLDN